MERQHSDEDASLRPGGIEPQRAAVGLRDPAGDGKAEACAAAGGGGAGEVDAEETVEDLLAQLRWNARTMVAHLDAHAIAVGGASHGDVAAARGVADGVL